ncbi:MAG: acyl-CoA/acyl-ACP dehydrogenase [Dehalococcoidales bacterium]|nr:acyl-CoA/acyl-ACP dehydrogenase [Dehalococcoidales bacterium]
MDFGLNEQQEMMQTLARDFLTGEYTDTVLKAMVKDEQGYTPELWQKLAKMNLTGLSIPEQYGGIGDFLDLIVVLGEMGRVCFLGPYFAALVLGASLVSEAGNEEQKRKYLPGIAEGKIKATLAVVESKAKYDIDEIESRAISQGGYYVLNGRKLFVLDAQSVDYIICAARVDDADVEQDGITLFIIDVNTPGVSIKALPTVAGDKQSEVVFENVKTSAKDILGEENEGWPYVERVLHRANIARCAEMVGMAEQVLKLTLDYAKERTAFGHPIGAFQSIQHRCADMLVDIDGSKFATYQAAWRLNQGLDAARETAIAKAFVSRACRRVMASAHQVHGAIGFTEDHILHYYTKRARAYESSFGGIDYHLGKLAGLK